MKKLKGWKSVAYGVSIGLISAFSGPEMQDFIAQNIEWLGPIFGTGVVVLRAFTNSPIFRKE